MYDHVACIKKNTEILKMLISNNFITVNMLTNKDYSGNTPLDVARKYRRNETVELLEQYVKEINRLKQHQLIISQIINSLKNSVHEKNNKLLFYEQNFKSESRIWIYNICCTNGIKSHGENVLNNYFDKQWKDGEKVITQSKICQNSIKIYKKSK